MNNTEVKDRVDKLSRDIIVQTKVFKEYVTNEKQLLQSMINEMNELRELVSDSPSETSNV